VLVKSCTIDGCGRAFYAKGWCKNHYRRAANHDGDPLGGYTGGRRVCLMDGCDRYRAGQGYCSMHYARLLRRGEVGGLEKEVVGYPDSLVRYSDRSGGPQSCWPWLSALTPMGYAYASTPPGRTQTVHVLMYEDEIGLIPEGMDLDHLCHRDGVCAGGPTCLHRRCINPAHLEPVSRQVNLLRGRHSFGFNGLCMAQVHDMTQPENIITEPSGNRRCRPCRMAYFERKRRAKAVAA
jgi:hypothetical protein